MKGPPTNEEAQTLNLDPAESRTVDPGPGVSWHLYCITVYKVCRKMVLKKINAKITPPLCNVTPLGFSFSFWDKTREQIQ
eukprot:4981210-Pyramimonas_sp.AAC.2